MKKCSKCNIVKPWSDYHKDKHSKTGYTSSCNDCRKAVRERSGIKSKYYPEKDRNRKLLREYGITVNQYEEMFNKQKGLCAICDNPETDKYSNSKIRDLSVDHCHTTGVVRGLLCNKCNIALGLFRDNRENLKKAIDYLDIYLFKIAV